MIKSAKSKTKHQGKFQDLFTNHNILVAWVIAAILTIIVAAAIIATPMITPLFYHGKDATQMRQYLTTLSSDLSFPGTLVYEKITDNGCGSNPTSWLPIQSWINPSENTVCTMTLQKYYKASGNAEANLRTADELVVRGGWQRDTVSTAASEFDKTFTHREATSLNYLYPDDRKPSIYLRFFPRDDTRYSDETAAQFVGIDQDIPLTGDEYVYGVQVTGRYRR